MNQPKLTETDIKRYNEGQEKIKAEIVDGFYDNCPDPILVKGKDIFRQLDGYAFITDPHYGFLDLFNQPDSPWQKGFKLWMQGMGYAAKTLDDKFHLLMGNLWNDLETPQMLVGYIIEYLSTDRGE